MMEFILLVGLMKGSSMITFDRAEKFPTYDQCLYAQADVFKQNTNLVMNGRLVLVCDKIKK